MSNAFALVFPGQGSQSVGMLSDLGESFSIVKQTFEEASEALSLDLWKLAQEGPDADLNQTQNTQPAMLAAGIAVHRVWLEQGGAAPAIMAGHSLGEYSALVAANSLQFADAVRLVAARGRYMQDAVQEGEGAMAAVLGLDDDAIVKLCAENAGNDVLEPVNFNSPGQVVVAGNAQAVQRLIDNAKAAGARRALLLPVSVPSHCSLMMPAAERLAEDLANLDIQVANVPVLHNVNVQSSDDAEAIRTNLAEQLYKPVRWVKTIESMRDTAAVATIIECGPGKVLAGLNKRIDKTMKAVAVADNNGLQTALETVNGG